MEPGRTPNSIAGICVRRINVDEVLAEALNPKKNFENADVEKVGKAQPDGRNRHDWAPDLKQALDVYDGLMDEHWATRGKLSEEMEPARVEVGARIRTFADMAPARRSKTEVHYPDLMFDSPQLRTAIATNPVGFVAARLNRGLRDITPVLWFDEQGAALRLGLAPVLPEDKRAKAYAAALAKCIEANRKSIICPECGIRPMSAYNQERCTTCRKRLEKRRQRALADEPAVVEK